jgi:Undecaprenyl-phosphate galactose phosphotransferase WbaP
MIDGHPNDAAMDFDALEESLSSGQGVDFSQRPGIGLGSSARNYLDAALKEPRWALPDSISPPQAFRRGLRTAGPFVLADLTSLMIAGLCAVLAVRSISPTSYQSIGWTGPAALALLVFVYWLGSLYTEVWIHPVVEMRQIIALSSVILLATAVGGLQSAPLVLWCGFAWLASLVLVPLFRVLLRHGLSRFSWWGYPTLVIGSGSGADELTASLLKTPYCSLRPALITDPEGTCRAGLLPVVNDPATLESLIKAQSIRHAVFAMPEFSSIHQQRMLDHYGRLLPHLLVLSDTRTLPALWGASHNGGRLSGFEVRNGRLFASMRLVKRAMDLTVAVLVIPILALLTIVIAVLSIFGSPGPLFYGHVRIGRHGRRIKVWKFRTMHVDAERMLEEHLAANRDARSEWELQHKLRDDPRITRLGKILRNTSLDELPQIWNVLKGDMSLVGPRPIVQTEVSRYGSSIDLYAAVKPGITGLWQVSGRTDISYSDRVELDVFYVRHWSPWLDLYILAKTIVTLLSRDGAY